ncbi:MAG: hypothetical protein ACETWG_04030 [Candidatus Neomarinimicrobiota bacterium]
MHRVNIAVPLLLFLMFASPFSLRAQEQGADLSARNIRARKLAQHWQDERVQLTLADGRWIEGQFVGADFYSFTLDVQGEQLVFSIDEVTAVTLKPGPTEAGLALMGGILGGGLGVGIVTLTVPGADPTALATAALLGAGVGLWWGYKTFYQEVVIELTE